VLRGTFGPESGCSGFRHRIGFGDGRVSGWARTIRFCGRQTLNLARRMRTGDRGLSTFRFRRRQGAGRIFHYRFLIRFGESRACGLATLVHSGDGGDVRNMLFRRGRV
jgi:hypothetical protein